jgi:hypothetical protein
MKGDPPIKVIVITIIIVLIMIKIIIVILIMIKVIVIILIINNSSNSNFDHHHSLNCYLKNNYVVELFFNFIIPYLIYKELNIMVFLDLVLLV